jgi:hypothetical protein
MQSLTMNTSFKNGSKLCSAYKSWKSLDPELMTEIYDRNVSGRTSTDLESYSSFEAETLPPPTKFADSRRKLLEMEAHGTPTPVMSPTSSSSDDVLNFPFSNCSDFPVLDVDLFCLVDIATQLTSSEKAARRIYQRKSNFVRGLQNEAERRRQGGCKC